MRGRDANIEKYLEWLKKYALTELTVKDGRFQVTLRKESLREGSVQYFEAPAPEDTAAVAASERSETVPLLKKDPSKLPLDTTLIKDTAKFSLNLNEVKAPLVGTFYRAPAPDAAPFVEEGDEVEMGEKLCIIEAMKIMNEIESPFRGVVREICIKNGTPVEFGQVLVRIET